MKTSTLCLLTLLVSFYCGAQNNLSSITQKDGMIGIGTSDPDQKLTVKLRLSACRLGSLLTERSVQNNSWQRRQQPKCGAREEEGGGEDEH